MKTYTEKRMEKCSHEHFSRVCNTCGANLIHQAEQEMLKRVVEEIKGMVLDILGEYDIEVEAIREEFLERLPALQDKEIINPKE